jgi:tetratricopeptide (TPR) repeat protein
VQSALPRPRPRPVRPALLSIVLLAAGCASAVPAAEPLERLEARVASDSTRPSFLLQLGMAYRDAGRLEEAAATLERVAGRRSLETAAAVFYLGVTYEDLGRYDRARQAYQHYATAARSGALRRQVAERLTLLRRRELELAVRESLRREAEFAATPPQPGTLAVFPFLYVGPDTLLAPLGRGLAEMLVTDLSQTRRIGVLERLHVQLLLDEMQLAGRGYVDPATAARSGRMLGAGWVVQGSIDGLGEDLGIEAAVVSATGDEPRTVASSGGIRRIFDMEKALALDIYRALGIELTPAERQRVTRRPTEHLQAFLAFGRGLQASDRADFRAAAEHFATAASLDPGFDLAREYAHRSRETAAAATVTPAVLAVAGAAELETAPPVDAAQLLIPAALGRDPAAEVLGQEGIGRGSGVLEMIIRRPGGNQ